MKSIRDKLFIQVGLIVVILVALFMIAYSMLFDPIYTIVAKNKLFDQSKYINQLQRFEYESINDHLSKYSKGFYVDAFIYDSDGQLIYWSNAIKNEKSKMDMMAHVYLELDNVYSYSEVLDEEKINSAMSYEWAQDYLLDTKTLSIVGTLDNGDRLILKARLIPSEISILAANRFAPIVGIFVFVMGLLFAYILSTKFTRPLVAMNKAADEIRALNFDVVCPVDSKDEIGQLAEKINLLSSKLKETIENLHIRNEELNHEIVEKTKIDENRKQLLINVSHELKTPLTLMQSYADGLKLNIAKNHNKVDYYCDVIMDETEKMNDMINKLLDINRIASGDILFAHEAIEIVGFLESFISRYKALMASQGINFAFNVIDPTFVVTDSKSLETVMSNLMDNAIKYVDDKKSISVSVQDVKHVIKIEVYNSADKIPEDKLDRLWDSFYKLDDSRNRNVAGHGLGLSIIKAIQESDQMQYGVRNVDEGVVFWIEVRKV